MRYTVERIVFSPVHSMKEEAAPIDLARTYSSLDTFYSCCKGV